MAEAIRRRCRAYNKALAIGRTLAAASPGVSLYQQDLAAGLFARGDMQGVRKGDIAGPWRPTGRGSRSCADLPRQPRRRLVKANAAVGLEKVGDRTSSRRHHRRSGHVDQELAIDRALAIMDPTKTPVQRS